MKLVKNNHCIEKLSRRLVLNTSDQFKQDVKSYGLSFDLMPRRVKLKLCRKEIEKHLIVIGNFMVCLNGLCE